MFANSECGFCHTLAAARSRGTIGPNLDRLKPSAERVARKVRAGGSTMPAFDGELSDPEIQAVADYVAKATGGQ